MVRNLTHRKYVKRLAVATGFYLVFLALAIRLVRDGGVTGAPAYLLAFLPGLAIAAIFWAAFRLLIEESDEYQRLLMARQMLVAAGFTLTLATMWGVLGNFGLVGHIDAFYYAALWFVGLGLGSIYNRITMGDDGRGGA